MLSRKFKVKSDRESDKVLAFLLLRTPIVEDGGEAEEGYRRGGERNSGVTALFLLFCIDCKNAMLGTGICVSRLLGRLIASFVVVVVHETQRHASRTPPSFRFLQMTR